MKAGLFQCDHVNPEYREKFGDYADMFMRIFPEFEWTLYDTINGHFPTSIDACEVYFATGSRHSVYEDIEWIHEVKRVIREIYNQKKYFIGFCFGHQLLGEALGGRVGKSPNGWSVGVHALDVLERKEWMEPRQDPFNLLMMCQDQVLDLPENATILAGSKQCPVGMFQVGGTMLGIQAHPEFSKEYDRLLMEIRMNRMGDKVAKAGMESLGSTVHSELIHQWVLKFLHNNRINGSEAAVNSSF